jgi:8-amino-7-oxononanoate synthase
MPVPILETAPNPITQIDGREYLYFVGTGYLGLQGHPEVIEAACRAARQYGIGSANSRTAFGTTPPLLDVERNAAALFGMDDAFYFASGWLGNHVLMGLLDAQANLMLVDECSHYSIFEAARAASQEGRHSCLPPVTFRHRDPGDLRAKLKEHLEPAQSAVVLSDGVFAATGRIAPVREYCDVLAEYPGSILHLDDAHGLGVLGENGRGTFEHAGLWPQISAGPLGEGAALSSPLPSPALFFCGTLSKALGGYGGIIPGSREFIRRVKLRSPHVGGVSPPPPPVAAATARAIELVMAEPGLRERLWANARLLKDGLRGMGFELDDSPVPIVCLTVGTAENMRRIQRELMSRGIAIAYMAAYSGLGPEGALRLAVFATHTEAMIRQLLEELRRVV